MNREKYIKKNNNICANNDTRVLQHPLRLYILLYPKPFLQNSLMCCENKTHCQNEQVVLLRNRRVVFYHHCVCVSSSSSSSSSSSCCNPLLWMQMLTMFTNQYHHDKNCWCQSWLTPIMFQVAMCSHRIPPMPTHPGRNKGFGMIHHHDPLITPNYTP